MNQSTQACLFGSLCSVRELARRCRKCVMEPGCVGGLLCTFKQRSEAVQLIRRPGSVALLLGYGILRKRVRGHVETALLSEDIEEERGRTKVVRVLRKSVARFGDSCVLSMRGREKLDVRLDERRIPDRLEGLIEERERMFSRLRRALIERH